VLHRDIKPPNILINEDNRPVLIDFGSARFDTAEATSTKVTFHTPPYAAIEQYVKTYPQGPWTDIYALGVVMYECVTGEKPPEVLERLHAGLGQPLAEGRWPGYSKRFLSSVDAAMIVKPDERPQSIGDWLPMFGRDVDEEIDDGDEATRFYAKQVLTEAIKPVPPTPNLDPKVPVETGVPADPKEAKFKRAGEETGARKREAEKKAAEEADKAAPKEPAAAGAAAKTSTPSAKPAKGNEAAAKKRKLSPAIMAGMGIAALAIVGVGALTLRGGGSKPEASTTSQLAMAPDNSAATVAALGPADATAQQANAVSNASGNTTAPQPAAPSASEQTNVTEALRSEKAKTAAAEAQLAAMKKAQARATAAQAIPGVPAAPTRTAERKGSATPAQTSSSSGSGVSSAKLAQFNSIVDEGRSMAKQVMRSSNAQNVQLAKNYDQYLKTLKDSMRGIQSDKEADKLIKQASQTRAYIQYLVHQQ
jgi:non-specific serine/threonine protein kinase